MDRFLNENNIIKKNSNIQNVLQKANLLKQQTQQKIAQLTPEQLASIQQDVPIQMNEPNSQNNFNRINNSTNNFPSEANQLQANQLEMNQLKTNQLEQQHINTNTNDLVNNILHNVEQLTNSIDNTQLSNINTQVNINNTQLPNIDDTQLLNIDKQANMNNQIGIDTLINNNPLNINNQFDINKQSINEVFIDKQSINNQINNNIPANINNNIQQKKEIIFDATNQLKTNNLQNNINSKNIIDKKDKTIINNEEIKEEDIVNNLNKDIKVLKKEILKTDKIFTPQETLIKKQIQAYNELVNLQVELEIINRMSIRVEEKLRQSYNTKAYNLQIRIREQEIRLGVIADLLSGKS